LSPGCSGMGVVKISLADREASRSWITRCPETETRRTPLANAAPGMRQRDAAGTAAF